MIPAKLDQISRAAGGELRGASSAVRVERVVTDSRGAVPGALFVALQGQQRDGHRFLADAFRNGASAALVARDAIAHTAVEPEWPLIVVPDPLRALQSLARWQRREFFSKVLAITGSNGKTGFAMAARAGRIVAKEARGFKTAVSSRHGWAQIPDARKTAGHRRGFCA